MNNEQQAAIRRSLRRHLFAGTAAIVILFGGFGGWAATTELTGAVIAPGTLVVEGKAKSVQHPTGGVVAELAVQEGQQVEAGDVLIRLDATIARANLAAVSANLNQLYARQARLEAERDGFAVVPAPGILADRLGVGEAEAAMTSERRLFADRLAARNSQKDQLTKQIEQLNEQIVGLEVQRKSKDDEIAFIEKEMVGTRRLYDEGLISLNRINSLDRSEARLQGERGQLIAQTATTKQRIAEIELKRLDIDQQMRAEVAAELRDVENRQSELIEKEVAVRDQLKRIDITAPVAGSVHDLAVHTVGGVVRASEDLMQIVPQTELTVEAKIAPQDIDQLSLGQSASLRLSAFNRNTTPEVEGKVIRISADLETDEHTGARFYRVAIAIVGSQRDDVPNLKLVPGMPIETAIRTGDRTLMSYFLKPLRDHTARVFREE